MIDLVAQWGESNERFKKEILKARKRGMNKAVMKIRNKTRRLIKSSLNHSTSSKYDDTLADGARVSKYKDSSLVGEAIAGAHIMGIRKKGSGTFRLRFFESDTAKRFVKDHERKNRKNGGKHKVKGHTTGRIKGKGFFKSAVDSEISKATSIIEEELNKAIEKCNNG